MDCVSELRQMYAQYNEKAVKARKNAPLLSGILGLSSSHKNDSCHMDFFEAVQARVEAFAAQSPSQEEMVSVIRWVLEAPVQYKKEEGYMYMFVCIGHIRPLIPMLSKENAAQLAELLNKLHPRRERLPLQDEVYKQLLKAGK